LSDSYQSSLAERQAQVITAPAKSARHIEIIDALRGIAILLVLFFHFCEGLDGLSRVESAFYGLFRVGWMGVDLFFVLSGFLITGILVDTNGRPRQMLTFYMRRTLRIFPLYFAFLTAVFIIIPLFEPALSRHHLTGAMHTFGGLLNPSARQNQIWFWTYATNFLETFRPGGAGSYSHFWSLAVEEQFYLVWPLLLTRLSLPRALSLCRYSFFAALALRLALLYFGQGQAANLMMPCRMDSLAAGAYVAIAWRMGRIDSAFVRRARIAVVVAPLLLMGVFIFQGFQLNAIDPFVRSIGYSIIAVLFGSLLTLCVMGGEFGWLNLPVFRMFGKYSYAIYVLHRPFHPILFSLLSLSAITASWHSPMLRLLPFLFLAPIASLAMGKLSWELWERHFLSLRKVFNY
jgi:peptidoglycan/LPS O-acetylase OafA/YrhL